MTHEVRDRLFIGPKHVQTPAMFALANYIDGIIQEVGEIEAVEPDKRLVNMVNYGWKVNLIRTLAIGARAEILKLVMQENKAIDKKEKKK